MRAEGALRCGRARAPGAARRAARRGAQRGSGSPCPCCPARHSARAGPASAGPPSEESAWCRPDPPHSRRACSCHAAPLRRPTGPSILAFAEPPRSRRCCPAAPVKVRRVNRHGHACRGFLKLLGCGRNPACAACLLSSAGTLPALLRLRTAMRRRNIRAHKGAKGPRGRRLRGWACASRRFERAAASALPSARGTVTPSGAEGRCGAPAPEGGRAARRGVRPCCNIASYTGGSASPGATRANGGCADRMHRASWMHPPQGRT